MTFVGEENVTVEEGSDAAFPLEHVLVEDLLIRCQGEGSWKRRFFLVPSSKGTLITFIARILEMSFDVSIFGPNLHRGAMN